VLDFKYYNTKTKNNRAKFKNEQEVDDFLKGDKYDLVEIVQVGSAFPAAVIYRSDDNLTFVKFDSKALNLPPTFDFDGMFTYIGRNPIYIINYATEKILERIRQSNP